MKKKILGSVCLVLGIAILVTTSTSFAYFTASSDPNNSISGTTINFNVDLEISTIHKATQLIPLSNSLIDDAITKSSNKCIDSKNYEVCTLYSLELTNSGDPVIIDGYLKTTSTSYITDNLKCQLFDLNYNAVSDIMTISRVVNEKKYFMSGTNMVNTQLNTNGTNSYYLAIWLTETNTLQNDDYSKNFSGVIGFESINGETIEAKFTS